MKNNLLIGVILLFIPFIQACNQAKAPLRTQHIIDNSGNQTELEKVISYYSKKLEDSLKLKAACFLIDNMKGWYFYEGEQLDHYQEYFKLIRRDQVHGQYFMNSFNRLYGPFNYQNLTLKNDIQTVRAEEMIGNIDMAFMVWKEQPWGKGVGFDDFCEYILPFRIRDEIPDYSRKEIFEQFNPLLDSIRTVKGDVVAAGKAINDALNQPRWLFTERTSFLPHFRASQIIKYRSGSCREMTNLAFYVMRAVGIPVAIDFVQQWPYRSSNHDFNVLLDNHKKMIAFLGAEDSPGTPHKPLTKKGKVYRHIYENNPESLANFIRAGDEVPSFLKDAKIKDVTDEYVHAHPVVVPLYFDRTIGLPVQKFAYLAVFDNKRWVPVDGGIIRNHVVQFKKVEGNIVYMAGYFHNSKIVPASDPFILNDFGKIEFLRPSQHAMHRTMTLSRIFPITADNYNTWAIKGCHFQGANRIDFSDARDLCTINQKPNPFWNSVKVKQKDTFRYIRFWAPFNTNMGEIELYYNGKKLKGKPMGTKTGWHPEKSFNNAFDGDIFTDFDSSGSDSPTWAGLDLGSGNKVDSIRYSPPLSEDSTARVLPHQLYELFYWRNCNWISMGSKTAEGKVVTFRGVSEKALYLLRNRSEQAEERIFTYKDGKQVWW